MEYFPSTQRLFFRSYNQINSYEAESLYVMDKVIHVASTINSFSIAIFVAAIFCFKNSTTI